MLFIFFTILVCSSPFFIKTNKSISLIDTLSNLKSISLDDPTKYIALVFSSFIIFFISSL